MTGANNPIANVRHVEKVPGVVVAKAVGEIDLHRSTAFQEALLALVEDRPDTIVVDLTSVAYMDSSGVASLVKLLARVRRDGISLKLAGLAERVRSVFEITRLDTVFEIYSSVEEALSS